MRDDHRVKRGDGSVARVHVAAPPDAVYDVISDVTRMGEWSPECVACEWMDGVTEAAVGARFRARNRHGLARWSNTPRVVVADRGRQFAFVSTDPRGRDMTRWTYELREQSDGTEVAESFELLRDLPLYLRLTDRFVMRVRDRKADLERAMEQTLLAIKAAVERTPWPT